MPNRVPMGQKLQTRPQQTLYMSQEDMRKALLLATDLLLSNELPKDVDGFCSINELCGRIKAICLHLDYINRNHIVELFFKDHDRKIFVSGVDQIKYKEIKYVQPPEILYFGTLSKLVHCMMKYGISSSTKGYLKLYGTPELAANFAKKFINNPSDKVTVLQVEALKAFSDGLKFSTFKTDEYIVVRIDKKYLIGGFNG